MRNLESRREIFEKLIETKEEFLKEQIAFFLEDAKTRESNISEGNNNSRYQ